MKGYNTLYYLLFVVLIMGAFASIAQNSYGQALMGGVAFAFSLLFGIQLMESLARSKRRNSYASLELFCLFVLSAIFGLRVFYINFSYVEVLFAATCLALALIYSRKMFRNFMEYNGRSSKLSLLVLLFYLVIILYFLSLGSITMLSQFSLAAGLAAFIFLVLLVVGALLTRNTTVEGENTSLLNVLSRKRDNAILILSLFMLFTCYRAFTASGLIPRIYSAEYPQAYFELVNKAESGKEKPVDGKYKYQEFKNYYDQFIDQTK
jgi:hypothetical protein